MDFKEGPSTDVLITEYPHEEKQMTTSPQPMAEKPLLKEMVENYIESPNNLEDFFAWYSSLELEEEKEKVKQLIKRQLSDYEEATQAPEGVVPHGVPVDTNTGKVVTNSDKEQALRVFASAISA